MSVLDDLLATLPEGTINEVRVGAFWTAVVARVQGRRRCGLASTLIGENDYHHTGVDDVTDAGRLTSCTGRQLAALARSSNPLEVSIGMAAVNALLTPHPEHYVELNAEEVILTEGAGRRVAVVGHFPFLPRCRTVVGTLWVLEKRPQGDDLPAEAAHEVLPQADVVAMSATTLMNRTFDDLIALCRPDALVLMLGPSTPLSPVLFDYGVHILSGSVVENIDAVLRAVSEGANFRQVRQYGVRLVTMRKS
ncbi:MAG: Rossmann-like domain-containing protein [Anaerolineae bacterium]